MGCKFFTVFLLYIMVYYSNLIIIEYYRYNNINITDVIVMT